MAFCKLIIFSSVAWACAKLLSLLAQYKSSTLQSNWSLKYLNLHATFCWYILSKWLTTQESVILLIYLSPRRNPSWKNIEIMSPNNRYWLIIKVYILYLMKNQTCFLQWHPYLSHVMGCMYDCVWNTRVFSSNKVVRPLLLINIYYLVRLLQYFLTMGYGMKLIK